MAKRRPASCARRAGWTRPCRKLGLAVRVQIPVLPNERADQTGIQFEHNRPERSQERVSFGAFRKGLQLLMETVRLIA